MGTTDDLKAAFAGESQANRKYTAFAGKADEEGYPHVAKLFRAAAAAETVHALNHLNVLGGVNSTEENLKTAIEGETYEFTEMYPEFIDNAKAESNQGAVQTFYGAKEVEKLHADLYKKALDTLGEAKDVDYYVCDVCGNTVENEAPHVCPICGAKKEAFFAVE